MYSKDYNTFAYYNVVVIVVVTGTPGCGKTKIAKYLSKEYKGDYAYCREFFSKDSILSVDKDGTKVIDVSLFVKDIEKFIKKYKGKLLVIDGHLSHYIHKKFVDLCLVVTCDIKVLRKRLDKRKYSKKKVRENMDSEIFAVCLTEAQENKHKIKTVDTSGSWEKTKQQLKDLKIRKT